jgi:hypothetical protein
MSEPCARDVWDRPRPEWCAARVRVDLVDGPCDVLRDMGEQHAFRLTSGADANVNSEHAVPET